jgi:YbbR domain-containing protein
MDCFTTGVSNIKVESDSMDLPGGVDITSVSPAEITIDLDKLVSKKVAVEPVFEKLEKGYEIIGDLVYSPKTVEINGPKQMLSNINTIETKPISLEGEKSNFSIEVPLQQPNKLVSIADNKQVKVSFDIQEENLAKEFNNIDIIFKNFNGMNYTAVDKAKAMIIFDGPYSIINNLSSNDIEVYVDAKDLGNDGSGNHKLRVKVDYPNPDNLNLNKLSPETIEIKLN